MTSGDDLPDNFFLCGKYRTETIDKFPIKIFTAFFNQDEEEGIQEGIDIANNGIGFEAYQLTDKWSDDVRVIYKVKAIDNSEIAIGFTNGVLFYFNDHPLSERVVSDWEIQLETVGVITVPAHELGHATGLEHCLFDYKDSCGVLEPNSIMSTDNGPELTDYNFMMKKQGEIMKAHLGDTSGTLDQGVCP